VDPILVPAPPRSAYNQNRRVSDLLFSQLKHFQHVVQKHGALGIPADLERDMYTEGGAALYIAAVTRALRGTVSPQPADVAAVSAPKPPQPAELAVVSAPKPRKERRKTVPGLAVAAIATSTPAPPKKSAAKKAVAKRRTARKTPRKQ
jgi:hypothetical protein